LVAPWILTIGCAMGRESSDLLRWPPQRLQD
jgi:hypothetical protein